MPIPLQAGGNEVVVIRLPLMSGVPPEVAKRLGTTMQGPHALLSSLRLLLDAPGKLHAFRGPAHSCFKRSNQIVNFKLKKVTNYIKVTVLGPVG